MVLSNLKICLIGCGNIADSQHGPAIKKYETLHPGVKLTACCDINAEKAQAFKQKFGLENFYTDINTMLEKEKPNAVSLNAPVEVTEALSIQILEKGIPLILEKPPGLTVEENERMQKAASLTPNMVAFNRRFMPLVEECALWLKETGAQISHIQYRMLRCNRRDPSFSTTAIHGIDLVRFLAGSDYKKLQFTYKNFPEYGKTVSNFHLHGEMASGALVNLDFLPISGINSERLEINTDKGIFFLHLPIWKNCPDGNGKLLLMQDDAEARKTDGEDAEEFEKGGFYRENEIFFDDIKNGRKPENNIKNGRQSVEIAQFIEKRQLSYPTPPSP